MSISLHAVSRPLAKPSQIRPLAVTHWQLALLLSCWIAMGLLLGYQIGTSLARTSFQHARASAVQSCEEIWPDPLGQEKADLCLGRYARFLGD